MSERIPAEEEYFARIEAEKLRRIAQRFEDKKTEEESEARRKLHYLHCGKCGDGMMTTRFRGVPIEVCPSCGAVLLDPGELEILAGEDRDTIFHTLATMFCTEEQR